MDSTVKVLVVDDDPNTRYLIELFCKEEPILLDLATNGREAMESIHRGDINIIVTDIRMPEMDGQDVLAAVQKFNPNIPVIIMTSYGTIEDAVHFLQSGAYDYITKPLNKETFCHRIQRATERFQMHREITRLKSSLERFSHGEHVVGHSVAIRKLMEKIPAIAQSEASTVIYGESGTGKELLAKTIHKLSRRPDKPFVPINCGALPDNLLESELFGHKRGAFTDAHADNPGLVIEANGGTLFLDEIGEISPKLQVKLLRFLQEKEIKPLGSPKTIQLDVRIISATNRDLKTAIGEGIFREDLYYRLNIVPIHLPPLRERKEDIPLLANYFVRKFCKELQKELVEISPLAMQKLTGYRWPGNIRELENKIQQTLVMTTSNVIQSDDIDLPGELLTFKHEKKRFVSTFEQTYILQVLSLHKGNISRAAHFAGMDRKNFWQLMKKYNINSEEFSVKTLQPQ